MTPMTEKRDVVVVGAGIAGAFAARELAKYQLDVLVLEAANDIAMGATRANSAIVHAGYDPAPGSLKARYNVRGSQMFPQLAQELCIPYWQNGSLVVAYSPEEMETVRELVARGAENGVEKVRELTREELLACEPNVSPQAVGALLAETGAICDPYHATLGALENAVENGVELRLETRVETISATSEGYTLELGDGSKICARAVVNAAGIFSDILNNQVSANKLQITPRRGEYCLYDTQFGDTFHHTMFQAPTAAGKGVLITPTIHGNMLVGPNAIAQESRTDVSTCAEGLAGIVQAAKKTWPELSTWGIITNFAGLRATGDTGDFVIGEPDDAPGFFNIACFESPGLTSAPAVAEDIAAQVASRLSAQKRDDFNPRRTAKPLFVMMSDEERERAIAADPTEGHVVCRCCKVSEADILAALASPIPVRSLDTLKWRTGAMMGRCHGGFCSPELLHIFVRETGIDPAQVPKKGAGSYMVAEARPDYRDLVCGTAECGTALGDVRASSDPYDVVVVGGGAAGIAAANAAAEAGAESVLLIDRERALGGILKQCIHSGFGLHRFKEELTGPEYARREATALNQNVQVMLESSVLRIDAASQSGGLHSVVVVDPAGQQMVQARAVVLSTGSRERGAGSVNIPGSRPAGVYSAGSAQNFVNLQGCLPGKRVVIQGTGDVGLIMARRLVLQGADVVAVYGTSAWPAGLRRNVVQCLEDYDIPLYLGKTISKLEGDDRLTAVWVSDAEPGTRKPIPGTEERVECDTLLLSIGLLPENEVAATAGVDLDPVTGGAFVDDTLQTNVSGIFACGNALHVHDLVDFASAEGDQAGLSAARYAQGALVQAVGDELPLTAGQGVRYIMPHKISPATLANPNAKLELLFRVRKPLTKPTFYLEGIDAQGERHQVKRRKARIAVPAEMEQIKVTAAELEGFVALELRAEEGGRQ